MKLQLLAVILCLITQNLTAKRGISRVFGKLFITAERNRTGYWNQKVLLEHSAARFESLSVNVRYDYSDCQEQKNLRMTFKIAAEPLPTGSIRSLGYSLEGRLGAYKFHAEPKTWSEAATSCREEGAHLFVPNSRQEVEPFLHLVASKDSAGFYVGIADQSGDGRFTNVFGVPIKDSGFSLWSLSEPDPRTSGCAVLQHWGYLDSVPCNSTRPFLCEKEMLDAASNFPVAHFHTLTTKKLLGL